MQQQQVLQIYEARPATQSDIDLLLRDQQVLRAIEARTRDIGSTIAIDIQKLILDARI